MWDEITYLFVLLKFGNGSVISSHTLQGMWLLTHFIEVKCRICVSGITIISSDNGLSPGQRQATNWTNAGKLLIEPFGTNFSEILIEIYTFLHSGKCIWKCCLENGDDFVSASKC